MGIPIKVYPFLIYRQSYRLNIDVFKNKHDSQDIHCYCNFLELTTQYIDDYITDHT